MLLITNLALTTEDEPETYENPDEGDEGSPLAQSLFVIPGLLALTIDGKELTIERAPDVEWHDLIEDVNDVLRDFFL